MKLIRDLVREEIRRLINDDAMFMHHDKKGLETDWESYGLEPEFDIPGDVDDTQMPNSCPICGTKHPGPCHNPAWDKKSSYMARPQLYRISKYSSELLDMIQEDEQLDDWIESYIAQAEQMMDAVYGKYEFKKSKHH